MYYKNVENKMKTYLYKMINFFLLELSINK